MAVEKILLEFDADIKALRSDMNDVKKQLGDVDKQVQSSGSKMTNTFKNLGKAIAAAFTIREMVRFGQEAVRLAATMEGVEAAFNRLGKPGLLDELRKATRGTVSDLELMQNAVKANNFQIPLDQLGKMFQFAAMRARETGESVDYLVESITLGIARKSIPILDNLGISSVQIQEEFKKTGDFAQAVGNIIDQSMGSAGATVETTAEKMERMSARFKNFQTSIGQDLLPLMDVLLGVLEDVGEGAVFLQDKMFELFNYLGSQKAKNALEDKEAKKLVDTYLEMGMTVEEAKFKLYELENGLASIPKSMAKLRRENNMNEEAYNKLVEAQDSMRTEMKALNTVVEILNSSMTGSPDGGGDGGLKGATYSVKEETEKYVFWLSQWLKEQRRIDMETAALKELFDGFQFTIDNTTQGIKGMSEAWKENYEQNQKNKDLMLDTISTYEKWQELGMSVTDVFGALAFATEQLGEQNSRMLEFSKQAAITQVLLSQGVSIANALKIASTSSVDPLTFFTTLATITATILSTIGRVTQLVNSAEVPAFATGVVDLKGSGTETSDSINARLSRGESVITAKGTRQDKGLFEAANKLKLEEYINKNYVLPALVKVQKDKADMFDDYRLYRALKDGQRQDREMNNQLIKALSLRVNKYNNWA